MSLLRARLVRSYPGAFTPFNIPDMTEAQIYGYAQHGNAMRKEEADYLSYQIQERIAEIIELIGKKK